MKNNYLQNCKICGLKQKDFPWGIDGKTPSFSICSCCGTEFGYEDSTIESIQRKRKEWVDSGYKWFRQKDKPERWDVEKQMKLIPK